MKNAIVICALLVLIPTLATARGLQRHNQYFNVTLGTQLMPDMDLSSNDGLTDAVLKANDAKMSFKTAGYGFAGAYGVKWKNGLRVETELSYYVSDLDEVKSNSGSVKVDGSLDMSAVMLNCLWEFENKTRWYTALGFGAGYGWSEGKLEAGGDKVSARTSIPLIQPIVDIGYQLDKDTSIGINYKYVIGLQKLDYDDLKGDYRAHRIGVGMRFNF